MSNTVDFDSERALFRSQLTRVPQGPEYLRANMIRVFLRFNILNPYDPEQPFVEQDEVFWSFYGPEGIKKFWEIECSEPVKITRFLDMMALTGADTKVKYRFFRPALADAMIAALKENAPLFIGDVMAFARFQTDWQAQNADDFTVKIEEAARWLLQRPKRRHLVPKSLALFLESRLTIPLEAQKVCQDSVDSWMLEYYEAAKTSGRPPPKRVENAFFECRNAIKATDRQMRVAMKTIPDSLKAPRGAPKGLTNIRALNKSGARYPK